MLRLEFWCLSSTTSTWSLDFNVRKEPAAGRACVEDIAQRKIAAMEVRHETFYGNVCGHFVTGRQHYRPSDALTCSEWNDTSRAIPSASFTTSSARVQSI
jgi:hypothetical protein